ncbi:fused MFS/spermidine synthase [Agromyces sp. SYSU K20354]|uniref:spermidine synthase n=1 Tax=Agromyces cavernae TaxID=2898659 RepID=UPI001E41D17F|nr:fused MFS/spermidine synthase [Agromyces cavernae]MCD2441619.1 fused MFS/spermidine synthase [Agromyces cavernae]
MEPQRQHRIEFEADVFSASGLTLLVDGTAQSHVDPGDPTRLFFEYVRRIGHVIDAIGLPGSPLHALHLGGGALTLPRYVAATRPGSRQVVVELDPELLELVLARLPLPVGADIALVVGDAASVIGDLASQAPFDVVIVDLYSRLEPPGFVATPEFMSGCLALVAPDGLLAVNVADASGLARLRAQSRAVARADPSAELLVTGDASVLSGADEGNAVLVAAPDGLPGRLAERLAANGPHPAEVLTGARLDFALWGAC